MKILWLKTEILHPVDKGGKIRTYEMLRRLKRDHEVTYVSFRHSIDSQESIDQAACYADRLITTPLESARKYSPAFYGELTRNLASSLPYAIQKYRSERMRRTIECILAGNDHDVVVCDFLTPCVNLNRKVDSPSILFQHNVESLIWERHYRTASNPVKRAFFYNQFRRMAKFEGAWLRKFDEVVAVSETDRQAMSERFGINNVRCVPTGVDSGYFRPSPGVQQSPSELIFTGSMDYMPNEDAILYFADAILPGIASAIDDVTLTVAGRNPTPRLQALARSNPRIRLTGAVPDIRPYLARAACFVVPIRVGGGTRLKIFEAMSMARPIVSTSLGAEGLPVSSGIHLEIADDPKAFAFHVVKLLTNARQAKSLAERARALVTEKFTWESAAAEFIRICEEVLVQKPHTKGGVSPQRRRECPEYSGGV